MQLRLLNFSSLVQNMAAAAQAASTQLLDLTIGSVLRAILEANAGMALWLQWLIARVLANTRAATSTGEDLDSWMGDFSVARLQAVAAEGTVTFARLTQGIQAAIPVGALVRTNDGTQTFAVDVDSTHPAFDSGIQIYTLAADGSAIDLPVRAVVAGVAGNVQAGAIGLVATTIPGVDSVTNVNAMLGGRDAESDAALRARFQNFMDTRTRATARAIGYAIGGIQQGLTYIVAENVDAVGQARAGSFLVVVDDGSGAPSAALIGRVGGAIEAMRPIGSSFTVRAPNVMSVDIAVTLTLAANASLASVIPAVGAAINLYVNTLPIGAPLTRSRIAQLAHDAHGAVLNVATIQLNGTGTDITPPAYGVIKPGVVVVS